GRQFSAVRRKAYDLRLATLRCLDVPADAVLQVVVGEIDVDPTRPSAPAPVEPRHAAPVLPLPGADSRGVRRTQVPQQVALCALHEAHAAGVSKGEHRHLALDHVGAEVEVGRIRGVADLHAALHQLCGLLRRVAAQRIAACQPLGPCATSNSTVSPSARLRKPSAWIAVKWTNTSGPDSCAMKPKPFASLNHFTLPFAILLHPRY